MGRGISFGISPLLFSFHPNQTMIDPTTLQTILEIGMVCFLGALALILWD
jgi:hypothetical protein